MAIKNEREELNTLFLQLKIAGYFIIITKRERWGQAWLFFIPVSRTEGQSSDGMSTSWAVSAAVPSPEELLAAGGCMLFTMELQERAEGPAAAQHPSAEQGSPVLVVLPCSQSSSASIGFWGAAGAE